MLHLYYDVCAILVSISFNFICFGQNEWKFANFIFGLANHQIYTLWSENSFDVFLSLCRDVSSSVIHELQIKFWSKRNFIEAHRNFLTSLVNSLTKSFTTYKRKYYTEDTISHQKFVAPIKSTHWLFKWPFILFTTEHLKKEKKHLVEAMLIWDFGIVFRFLNNAITIFAHINTQKESKQF